MYHPECIYTCSNLFLLSANLVFKGKINNARNNSKVVLSKLVFLEDRKSTVGRRLCNFTILGVLAHFLKSHMGTINTWRDFPAIPVPHPSTHTHVFKPFMKMNFHSPTICQTVLEPLGVPSFGSSQRLRVCKDVWLNWSRNLNPTYAREWISFQCFSNFGSVTTFIKALGVC